MRAVHSSYFVVTYIQKKTTCNIKIKEKNKRKRKLFTANRINTKFVLYF